MSIHVIENKEPAKKGCQALELVVVLKDEERTYKHKFLLYDAVTMVVEDKIIKTCIDEAMQNFPDPPTDIVIKTTMVIQ